MLDFLWPDLTSERPSARCIADCTWTHPHLGYCKEAAEPSTISVYFTCLDIVAWHTASPHITNAPVLTISMRSALVKTSPGPLWGMPTAAAKALSTSSPPTK